MVTGSDTTELGVAGTLYYLGCHPEQRDAVLADPARSAWAFAETLRFDHPTDILGRCVVRDVEVGRKALRAGQGVLLLWGSANRDEAEFPHADEYDITRRYERSLVFGHGRHKCIGEHIGIRAGTVMLEELFTSIGSFTVDVGDVGRRCGEFLKGYDRVPVSVTRRG
jgi:cytochrome P450